MSRNWSLIFVAFLATVPGDRAASRRHARRCRHRGGAVRRRDSRRRVSAHLGGRGGGDGHLAGPGAGVSGAGGGAARVRRRPVLRRGGGVASRVHGVRDGKHDRRQSLADRRGLAADRRAVLAAHAPARAEAAGEPRRRDGLPQPGDAVLVRHSVQGHALAAGYRGARRAVRRVHVAHRAVGSRRARARRPGVGAGVVADAQPAGAGRRASSCSRRS